MRQIHPQVIAETRVNGSMHFGARGDVRESDSGDMSLHSKVFDLTASLHQRK
jgi:hypothetical protein